MHEILWPKNYVPGFADNFASNEVIVAGLKSYLVDEVATIPQLGPQSG